jgi:hypothetical protein
MTLTAAIVGRSSQKQAERAGNIYLSSGCQNRCQVAKVLSEMMVCAVVTLLVKRRTGLSRENA